MRIRPYVSSDAFDLRRMFYRQGFDYEFPDTKRMISKMVVEDGGITSMAVLCRPTCEAYFLMDQDYGSPDEKWRTFLQLHEAVREDCLKKGLEDVFCFVPPQIAKSFGRRLMRIGWGHNLWPAFNRKLDVPTHDKKEEGPCVYLSESQVKLLAGA